MHLLWESVSKQGELQAARPARCWTAGLLSLGYSVSFQDERNWLSLTLVSRSKDADLRQIRSRLFRPRGS